MGYKRESKYHLITANFEEYDFSKLFNEEEENDCGIIWRIGNEGGKRAQNYNIGDICYIHYTKLPDGTSRILLRAEVVTSDTDNNIKEEVYSYDSKNKVKGIYLSKIRAIALEEPTKFDNATLASEYNKSFIQGQQYLGDINYEGSKEQELISALESYPNPKRLKAVRDYFNNYTKCFFSAKDKKMHNTFISGRGLNFYETHHFILENYIDKVGQHAFWLKNEYNNKIHLCPTCHRKIHHGNATDVKKMIDDIFASNSNWFDSKLIGYAKEDGFSNTSEWIYYIYNQERKKNKYEMLSKSSGF